MWEHALRKHAPAPPPLMTRELFNCNGLLMNVFVQEIFSLYLFFPCLAGILCLWPLLLFSFPLLFFQVKLSWARDFNVGMVIYLIVGLVFLYDMLLVQISHVNYPTSPMIYKFLLMGS